MITAPTTISRQTVSPDVEGLRRGFNDLAMEATRSDAQLTEMYGSGKSVGQGWNDWFSNMSQKALSLRDGASGYLQASGRGDLVQRLGTDSLDLSESAGRMAIMYSNGSTLGSGWTTTLDRKIADFVDAANALAAPAPPTNPPVPPVQPPHPPTTPPTTPSKPGVPAFHGDVSKAVDLVNQSISQIRTVPESDRGDESTKQARIGAYKVNLAAQALLEPYFTSPDQALVSTLRRADASLEDANWQLAKKPSPDGRFNGVDIPGALRDSRTAVELLNGLLSTVPA